MILPGRYYVRESVVKAMYIGVKYCGGCNPSYDRKAEVERLAAKLDMDKLEPVQDGIKYDRIWLVCGCQRACIRKYQAAGMASEYCILKSIEDFRKLIQQFPELR